MRSPAKKQSKKVSTPVAILVIVGVVIVASLIGFQLIKPEPAPGVMSKEASMAATSRYRYVVDRWNKEVAAAKAEGRAPDERLKPRPTGAMATGGRPLGMEGFGPGSLETVPGGTPSGGTDQGSAGPISPPGGR